jgi:probable F420-dependent oxidoreductase
MRIGVTMFVTDLTVGTAELAADAEERGFESLYLPEHTHIPVSRRTPAPTGDEVLDPSYSRTVDPWVALGSAASITNSIRLGSGIALVAQHDPIALAKAVATLDHVSGGRAVLGIGYGWNHEEMEDHGVDPSQRRRVVREYVLAMQALWTQDEASFHGSFVNLEPSWAWPKPVRGTIAVLIGGAAGPTLFKHVAEYGNGWIPIGGAGLSKALPELRQAWAEAGRPPETLEVVPFGTLPDEGKLEHYRSIGVTEVVLRLPGGTRDQARETLDRYAAVVGRV